MGVHLCSILLNRAGLDGSTSMFYIIKPGRSRWEYIEHGAGEADQRLQQRAKQVALPPLYKVHMSDQCIGNINLQENSCADTPI